MSKRFVIYFDMHLVAQGTSMQTKEIASVTCVDVDVVDCDLTYGNGVLHAIVDKDEQKTLSITDCIDDPPQSKSLIHEEFSEFKLDNHESRSFLSEAEKRCLDLEASSPAKSQLNCDHKDSPSSVLVLFSLMFVSIKSLIFENFRIFIILQNEPVDVTLDVEESMSRSSSSSPSSEMVEEEDDGIFLNT